MIIHILISIAFYFVLMYLSINFLGFFVRGLFSNPELDRLKLEGSNFIKNEIKKHQRAEMWVNIIAPILLVVYLYLLVHFWNVGVMIVAIILMIGRLDGLLWEIKNGQKTNVKLMPKNVWFFVSTILILAALPLLYYFIYIF